MAHRQRVKVRKYEELCNAEGMEIMQLALATFKGWQKVTLQTLTKLEGQLARVVGRDEDQTIWHFRTVVSEGG